MCLCTSIPFFSNTGVIQETKVGNGEISGEEEIPLVVTDCM